MPRRYNKEQHETGNAVANKFYNQEELRQESQQKQEAAQKTRAEIDKNGRGKFTGSQKDYDEAYQYAIAKSLEDNKGKPVTPENDVRIAEKFLNTHGTDSVHENKLKEAIKNHSPVAARLPEEKRHEYAGSVMHNAHLKNLSNTSREENTRVPTHRAPEQEKSQLEMMKMLKEMKERD